MNDATQVAVGVVVLAHGDTASAMLDAARGILGPGSLSRVVALDAGVGDSPELAEALCDTIGEEDAGRGVLVLVDLIGSSPFRCAQREAQGHACHTLAGLNLAMLLKLATLDLFDLGPEQLASALADSGRKAVAVTEVPDIKPSAEGT